MSVNDLLTVGIPTFNRRAAVVSLVESLLGEIPLLVVDDGSRDGTADALSGTGVELIVNPQNLGYARTFLRLIAECRTPYLLVTADDDDVDATVLDGLVAFLDSERPDFVSTQWTAADEIYRGSSEVRRIDQREFLKASAHAPGLVYRVEAVRWMIDDLERLIGERHEMATLYPQVLMLARLLSEDADCFWWDGSPVRQGSALPSQLKSPGGDEYASADSRIRQFVSLDGYLANLGNSEAMRRQLLRRFYKSVRSAVPREFAASLDASAADFLRGSVPSDGGWRWSRSPASSLDTMGQALRRKLSALPNFRSARL